MQALNRSFERVACYLPEASREMARKRSNARKAGALWPLLPIWCESDSYWNQKSARWAMPRVGQRLFAKPIGQ
jgi:hypothetical protein